MNPQEFFYFSLGFGFLILAGFLSFAAFYVGKSFKSLSQILEDTGDITRDVNMLKNGLKVGILSFLEMFLKKRR